MENPENLEKAEQSRVEQMKNAVLEQREELVEGKDPQTSYTLSGVRAWLKNRDVN